MNDEKETISLDNKDLVKEQFLTERNRKRIAQIDKLLETGLRKYFSFGKEHIEILSDEKLKALEDEKRYILKLSGVVFKKGKPSIKEQKENFLQKLKDYKNKLAEERKKRRLEKAEISE